VLCAAGYAEKMLYVLILDHMETFASPTRQMLLYTLFDLHHRSDVKFIVIGLTDK
jgi:Cdc6-like AAA superfamily ATPase